MNFKLALILLVAVIGIAECKPSLRNKIAKAANSKRGGDEPEWPWGWFEYASVVGKCVAAMNWLEYLKMDPPAEGILADACPKAIELAENLPGLDDGNMDKATELVREIFPLLQCVNLQAEIEEIQLVLALNKKDAAEDEFLKGTTELSEGCMKVFESVEEEEEEFEKKLKELDNANGTKRGDKIMSLLRQLLQTRK